MTKLLSFKNNKGFTLIEVIIALIIFAIAGTMLVMVAGQNLTQSTVPVTTLDNLLLLQEEMESINARYYSDLAVIGSIDSFIDFLNNYASTGFTVSHSDFNDGGGANPDILQVELTSTAIGATLVTLMSDITN